jgi:hypothetical protein
MFNSGILVLFDIIRALVFLGLKSTSHVFTKFASKDSLYFETGWETLANRRETRKLTTFYKIHNKLCPPYLLNVYLQLHQM